MTKGKRLMDLDNSGEIIEIVSNNSYSTSSGNATVTIKRGADGTTAKAVDKDAIKVLSTASVGWADTLGKGELIDTDTPSVFELSYDDENNFQIFKEDVVHGKMMKGVKLIGNENNPKFIRNLKLYDFYRSMNRTIWWGQQRKITGPTNFHKGSMGGIHGFFLRYHDRIYQREVASTWTGTAAGTTTAQVSSRN